MIPAFLALTLLWSVQAFGQDIHPLCMEKLAPFHAPATNKPSVVDIPSCSALYKDLPFSKNGSWQAVWNSQLLNSLPEDENLPSYVAYNIVGGMNGDQILVQQVVNYGGSRTFSSVMLLKGLPLKQHAKPKLIEQTLSIPGGDRCLGGIEDVAIYNPDTIIIHRRLTPAELMRYGQKDNRKNQSTGLPDCAICCLGTAQEQWNLAMESKEPKLISVTIAPRERSNSDSQTTRCLYGLLGTADNTRINLTAEELTSLQQNYWKQCIRPDKAD